MQPLRPENQSPLPEPDACVAPPETTARTRRQEAPPSLLHAPLKTRAPPLHGAAQTGPPQTPLLADRAAWRSPPSTRGAPALESNRNHASQGLLRQTGSCQIVPSGTPPAYSYP